MNLFALVKYRKQRAVKLLHSRQYPQSPREPEAAV